MTVYFFIILFICALDQFTKLYAMDLIANSTGLTVETLRQGASVPIIEKVLNFTYVENDGMSFGLLDDKRWIFMTLSIVGILLMTGYLIYIKGKEKMLSFALALVIGGGIGNMFDRISLGYVVDFIDVCCFDFWMWTFNVADSAICIGAGFVILALLLDYKQEKKLK